MHLQHNSILVASQFIYYLWQRLRISSLRRLVFQAVLLIVRFGDGKIPSLSPIDDVQPVRSDPNPSNRDAEQLLYPEDVLLRIDGKLFERLDGRNVLRPARQCLVHQLDAAQGLEIGRHRCQNLAVVLVGLGDLDLLQACQYVQLGQIDGGEAIDEGGEFHLRDVQPATSPCSACGGAVLGADGTEVISNSGGIIDLLGGKWSLADTGSVRLDRAVDAPELPWRYAQTGEDRSDTGVGRRHVRVGAEIDIQHGSVGTLHEDLLPILEGLVGKLDGIDRHLVDALGDVAVELQLSLDVDLEAGEGPHVMIGEVAEALLEVFEVAQIADADAVALDLGGVGRADALLGRADLVPAETVLEGAVDLLVEVEDEVGAVRDLDAAVVLDAAGREGIELVEEGGEVDDDAIADDARGLVVENARGKQMELVLLALYDDGMTSVGAASDTGADVVFLSERAYVSARNIKKW